MSGQVLDGRYRLDGVLGRGGVATVWRGWDLRLERAVAVKVLDRVGLGGDPNAVQRFDREARTLAQLIHPNIVALYDVGSQDGVAYLVMELVDGQSLAAVLADGPLSVARAAATAAQTCDALTAAHRAGVVHRDIKPANILIPTIGGVKVCDFGIARLQHAAGQTLTAVDTAVGTSDYMAPEQAAGDPVDARTDLYAVGCVLYAMLTGSPPFTGDGPISVVYQHLNRAPAPVRSHRGDVPPGLDHLVGQLLAKNPADRPGDAAQVQARLAGWAAQPGRAGRDTLVINPAAPGSFPTGRAAAAVATPTRTLPAGTPVGDRPPDMVGDRRRVTPGRLAALAAVIVILLIGAVLATQLTGTPSQHQAAPPASTPATTAPAPTAAPPSTTAPTSPTPSPSAAADQVTALRVAVQQLAQTGQLDPHAAQDLGHQLDDLTRTLTRGQAHDTLGRIAALQTKLTQLRNDNKITPDGYTTLTASLNQLAGSLPPPTAGNG